MDESDSSLMRRVCSGDDEAFAAIVDRYKDSLLNYLTHMVRSRERAEELAQEAFVRLYGAASRYCEFETIAPHLFRIATNHTISEIRRENRWRLLRPRLEAATARHAPPADAALLSNEIQREVTLALDRLPVKYRAPLVLYEIEEWSYEDIARALECRVGTVKSRIFRARELMRSLLAAWWTGGEHERRRTSRTSEQAPTQERIAAIHS